MHVVGEQQTERAGPDLGVGVRVGARLGDEPLLRGRPQLLVAGEGTARLAVVEPPAAGLDRRGLRGLPSGPRPNDGEPATDGERQRHRSRQGTGALTAAVDDAALHPVPRVGTGAGQVRGVVGEGAAELALEGVSHGRLRSRSCGEGRAG